MSLRSLVDQETQMKVISRDISYSIEQILTHDLMNHREKNTNVDAHYNILILGLV